MVSGMGRCGNHCVHFRNNLLCWRPTAASTPADAETYRPIAEIVRELGEFEKEAQKIDGNLQDLLSKIM